MITPTVGRVVWYFTPGSSLPLAAHICHVFDDRTVNLMVISGIGEPFPAASVPLVQDDDTKPSGSPWCEWMPYQRGQAAHTEAVISAAAAAAPLVGRLVGVKN